MGNPGQQTDETMVLAIEPDSSARLFPSQTTAAAILRHYPGCYLSMRPNGLPEALSDCTPLRSGCTYFIIEAAFPPLSIPDNTQAFLALEARNFCRSTIGLSQSSQFDLDAAASNHVYGASSASETDSRSPSASSDGVLCRWTSASSSSPSPRSPSSSDLFSGASPSATPRAAQMWPLPAAAPQSQKPPLPAMTRARASRRASWPMEDPLPSASTNRALDNAFLRDIHDLDSLSMPVSCCACCDDVDSSRQPSCTPPLIEAPRRSSSSSFLSSLAKIPTRLRSLGSRSSLSSDMASPSVSYTDEAGCCCCDDLRCGCQGATGAKASSHLYCRTAAEASRRRLMQVGHPGNQQDTWNSYGGGRALMTDSFCPRPLDSTVVVPRHFPRIGLASRPGAHGSIRASEW